MAVYEVYGLIVLPVAALFALLLFRSFARGRVNILLTVIIGYLLYQLLRAPFAREKVERGTYR